MKREKLLAKARNSPRGWKSGELCRLLEAYGFVRRTIGDELRYEHETYRDLKMSITKASGDIHQGYIKDSVKQIDESLRRNEENQKD